MKRAMKIAKGPSLQDRRKAIAYFESKMGFTLGPAELKHRMDAGDSLTLVDVRRESQYDEGHIPGAICLPRDRWAEAVGLSKEHINIFYCNSQQCHLAPEGALYFAKKGFPVMELEGGIKVWKEDFGYALEGGSTHSGDAEELARAA